MARAQTKQAMMLEMLRLRDGVTISELVIATGWKPNTVHAALTTMRKLGYDIASISTAKPMRYRVENSS